MQARTISMTRLGSMLPLLATLAVVLDVSVARAVEQQLWINPASLLPKTPAVNYTRVGEGLRGEGEFVAAVQLPASAIVRKLRIFGRVGADPSAITGALVRVKPSTLDGEVVAVATLAGPDVRNPVVDTDGTTSGTAIGSRAVTSFSLAIGPDDPEVIFYGALVVYDVP